MIFKVFTTNKRMFKDMSTFNLNITRCIHVLNMHTFCFCYQLKFSNIKKRMYLKILYMAQAGLKLMGTLLPQFPGVLGLQTGMCNTWLKIQNKSKVIIFF